MVDAPYTWTDSTRNWSHAQRTATSVCISMLSARMNWSGNCCVVLDGGGTTTVSVAAVGCCVTPTSVELGATNSGDGCTGFCCGFKRSGQEYAAIRSLFVQTLLRYCRNPSIYIIYTEVWLIVFQLYIQTQNSFAKY